MKPKGWIDEPLYNRIKEIMPIPIVDLLVTHRGRLLLMLRNNEPAKDQGFTPGGRILRGETIGRDTILAMTVVSWPLDPL